MEFCGGGELFRRIQKSMEYTEQQAAALIRNVLEALVYLHDYNIVHRDLKPENLLMKTDSDTDCKVADFGLAVRATESLTSRCGSPGYVAPEILKGHQYGCKVDVFSLGVILFILLSGKPPFTAK